MTRNGVIPDRCAVCKARQKSVFANASPEDLEKIDEIRSLVHFQSESALPLTLNSGEAGFYCMRDGHARIDFRESRDRSGTVRIGGPGDMVGFSATRHDHYSVHSLEDGSACFFSYKDFAKLQTESAAVVAGVLKVLSEILFLKDRRVCNLQNFSVRCRVAMLLLGLDKKFGAARGSTSLINVRIDRKTLARLAGTSPESLARVLTLFEVDGLIVRKGRLILISDRPGLVSVADS